MKEIKEIKETFSQCPDQYLSCCDGSYYLRNPLLSDEGQTLLIILYVDDLEIANPQGISNRIHKVCAGYWIPANLPVKYRLPFCANQIM